MNRSMKQVSRMVEHGRNVCKRVAAVSLLGLAVLPAGAATPTWIGGTGTWDDTTKGNWNTAAVPVNGDTVNLTQAAATDISIDYTAANLTGTGLQTLYLYHTGAAKTTFTLDGTGANAGVLPVSTLFSIGQWADGDVEFNLKDEAILSINGGNVFRLGIAGRTGTFTVNQSGGTFTNGIGSGSMFYVGMGGTYNLSGTGVIRANRGLTVESGGIWNQTGGSATFWSGSTLAMGANSTFLLSAGSFLFSDAGADVLLAQNAHVSWAGGTFAGNNIRKLKLNESGARWTMQGGTITVNNAGTSSAAKDSFVIAAGATVQGYGTIQDNRFGLTSPATFETSGQVIANGYGADRDFDLSRFGSALLVNSTDNPSTNGTNGWFAVRGGKLLLPAVAVLAGSSVTNWGDATADTTIDLVNSARIAFTGATAGNLTGALLAVDRADVPAGLYRPTAVWTFGGIACASATLTLRYDDAAAAVLTVGESDLRVWRHNGAKWEEITGTQDTGTKTITSQATGSLAATSFFAVAGKAPAAGTLVTIR